MMVYGVCWQDCTEPWGWEPETLWFTREDAEREYAEQREAAYSDHGPRWDWTPEQKRAAYDDEHSIQEYEVQAKLPRSEAS